MPEALEQRDNEREARLAALDVGDARIGLAVGDGALGFAFGRGYLVRKDPVADVQALLAFFSVERVERVVVGLPLLSSGQRGPQAEKTMVLARALQDAGVQLEFLDERFTTQLAQSRLRHVPKRIRGEKGKLDEAAAVAILETYLGV